MNDLNTLLERNQTFSEQYDGGLALMPKFSTFVLTCADARIDPAHFLGLELGEALVFRNAGGRVTDEIELDVGVLWTMAAKMAGENFPGFSLALIQHIDCGYERLANEGLTAVMSQKLGIAQSTLAGMANGDHVQSIHNDIARLQQSPLVPDKLVVSGHIYHVEDGTLEEVVAPIALQAMQGEPA